MKTKNVILIISLLSIILLCSCNTRASLEAEITEYNEKISSLNSDLNYYQTIYDEALSSYQEYNIYSGKTEWDSELSKTKDIMNEANSKIAKIKRDIALYESFKESKEKELEKYD